MGVSRVWKGSVSPCMLLVSGTPLGLRPRTGWAKRNATPVRELSPAHGQHRTGSLADNLISFIGRQVARKGAVALYAQDN